LSSVPDTSARLANIPVAGIVGGIGSGKSSLLPLIKGVRLYVVDADCIGHELLTHEDVREQLCDVFGDEVLDAQGKIDRGRVARQVFGESKESHLRRMQLNSIMHPAIKGVIETRIRNHPSDADVVVLDAALLLEAGWSQHCDAIVFIDTPLVQRQQRVRKSRGWSLEEHRRRESTQWELQQKHDAAEFTVDNSGTPVEAAQQLEQVFKTIIQRFQDQHGMPE
jgi:dephospho-CoA kinase